MGWLIGEMWLLLLLAALIGFIIGWLWRRSALMPRIEALEAELGACRQRGAALETERARAVTRAEEVDSQLRQARDETAVANSGRWAALERVRVLEIELAAARRSGEAAIAAAAPLMTGKPAGLAAADGGKPDDLKSIVGIGPVNERALNALGVFHFRQLAAWTPANVDWVERHLDFPGRVTRERWIDQARYLAAGDVDGFRREFGNPR